jgi:hypothetical protein
VPTKVPMDRKAACKCTFAAAALHGGDCDDRAHPSSVARPQKRRIIRIDVIVFLANCLLVAGNANVSTRYQLAI